MTSSGADVTGTVSSAPAISTSERPADLLGATTVATWAEICAGLADAMLPMPSDPFILDTVIVPSAGHQRSLSQYLATRTNEGVCAGVEFVTLRQFRARLLLDYLGIDRSTDPWRPRELTVAILNALDASSDQPWFGPLGHYLRGCDGQHAAAGRRAVTARRVARLYQDYLSFAPNMIEQWNQGFDLGPEGSRLADAELWQPELWRVVRGQIAGIDPLTRHHELCRRIVQDDRPTGQRIFAALVDFPDLLDGELLAALASQRLQIWQLGLPSPWPRKAGQQLDRRGSDFRQGSDLLRRYANTKAAMLPIEVASPNTTLARLQADLQTDRAPSAKYSADGTVQVHLSHGPERQVEVLREVLTGLFEDIRDLEPREVLILTPQLDRYSAHLAACFSAGEQAQHPGQLLRAQLSGTSLAVDNPLLDLARQLLSLPDSRAFTSDLVELISQPAVARRFELRPDDADELAALFETANASWGVDTKHRQSFGVAQSDGTWWQSIERMLLGIAMPADTTADLGGTVPIDSVRSDDVARIGALAEFVSRVRSHLLVFEQPATVSQWSSRLRQALLDLTASDFESQWQLTQAISSLADWQAGLEQSYPIDVQDHEALLTAAEVLSLFDDWVPRSKGRPNFGNGTMLIGELGELQAVEHRIIVLLGLDDEIFPIRQVRGGDDLLAGQVSDRKRLASRQQFLDAILAAQERFIVIAQGADERTNMQLPEPIAVQDLLAALGTELDSAPQHSDSDGATLVRRHALQAHSWANFTNEIAGRPFSFDREALHGAVQLSDPARSTKSAKPAWSWEYPAQPWEEELSVTQLADFLRHPARFLLKDLHGLQLRPQIEAERESLPLDPDLLDQYDIADAMLKDLLAGADFAQARNLELGRGRVLRNQAGWALLNTKLQDVTGIYQRLMNARAGQLRDEDCVVDLELPDGPVRLTARVRTWDGRVVQHTAGNANPNRTVQLWLDLLMLAASSPTGTQRYGTLVARSDVTFRAPDANFARQLLGEIVTLRHSGKTHLTPLPLRSARAAADPANQQSEDAIRKAWEGSRNSPIPGEVQDPYWSHFFHKPRDLYRIPPQPNDPASQAKTGPNRFTQLARWLFDPMFAHESRMP